jgi:hypothetical protein
LLLNKPRLFVVDGNFGAKPLEGFEVWDRTVVHASEHQELKVAFVSVRLGGNIGMNRAAYEM